MLRNEILSNNRGASKLGIIFWLAVFAATAYAASKAAPPFIAYYMLKTDVKNDVMKNAHMYSDAEVEKLILNKAHSWSVPIGHDEVVITRLMESISVKISWSETININNLYVKTVYFDIAEEAPLKPGPYGLR